MSGHIAFTNPPPQIAMIRLPPEDYRRHLAQPERLPMVLPRALAHWEQLPEFRWHVVEHDTHDVELPFEWCHLDDIALGALLGTLVFMLLAPTEVSA